VTCLPAWQVVERPAAQVGGDWAQEFGEAQTGPSSSSAWAQEFQQQQPQQPQQAAAGPSADWADEFAKGVADLKLSDAEELEASWAEVNDEWAKQFGGGALGNCWLLVQVAGCCAADVESCVDKHAWTSIPQPLAILRPVLSAHLVCIDGACRMCSRPAHALPRCPLPAEQQPDAEQLSEWERIYGAHAPAASSSLSKHTYEFAANNPFLGDPEALAKGRSLFKVGPTSWLSCAACSAPCY
jgi:hypothetical protein